MNSSYDVIIPIYNCEKYIVSSIESVVNQTLRPQKIILVDDECTDRSISLAKNYLSKFSIPFEVCRQKNKGIGGARNLGLTKSDSDWIAFLDADDLWEPKKIEKQFELLTKTTLQNVGVIYSNYINIDENLNVTSEPVVKAKLKGKIFESLLKENLISGSGSAVIMKRECFLKIGYFDESRLPTEDWDYWMRASMHYEFDFCEEALVKIRRHQTNTTNYHKQEYYLNSRLMFYCKYLPFLNKKPDGIINEIREIFFQISFLKSLSYLAKLMRIYKYSTNKIIKIYIAVFMQKMFWTLFKIKLVNEINYKEIENRLRKY